MTTRAYEGKDPYIFVSYAHKDSDTVVPIISRMQDNGYRVWFDAGIEAGTEWPEYIAEHLYGCSVFLAFLSQSALASQNCRQEINFAVELKKKTLLIRLDETEIPVGLQMRLGFVPQIHMNRHGTSRSFLEELFRNELLRSCCEESQSGTKVSKATQNTFLKGLACDLDKNYTEAAKWYRQAADEGHKEAQYCLGCSYDRGEGVACDSYEAVRWWRRAAEQGHTQAQYSLGCCLSSGTGTMKDPSEAARWFHLAAQKGHAGSMNNLGNCYMNGTGVAKNVSEAVRLFREAAELGSAHAQMAMGNCCATGAGVAKDPAEALRWFKKAGEQGLALAQHNAGVHYANGLGTPQDYTEAAKWYRMAAEQGYDNSQINLGVLYEYGAGVSKDYAEAEKWYRKAAEQGNEKAAEGLRRIGASGTGSYSSGMGSYSSGTSLRDTVSLAKAYFLRQQYREAAQLFHQAAQQGDAESQWYIGFLLCQGQGVQQDPVAGASWYRRAAEQGHAPAQCFLGNCYMAGMGVPVNYTEAIKWFRLSAQQGCEEAQEILRRNSISW